MDFGLARDLKSGPSVSGALIGSPAYWSPEQAQGERATERSDVYTMGLVACDVFGAKRPGFGEPLRLEGVPAHYRIVLERCLKLQPRERFASAKEVHRALILARRRVKLSRVRRRWTLLIGAGAGVFVVAALVYGLLGLGGDRSRGEGLAFGPAPGGTAPGGTAPGAAPLAEPLAQGDAGRADALPPPGAAGELEPDPGPESPGAASRRRRGSARRSARQRASRTAERLGPRLSAATDAGARSAAPTGERAAAAPEEPPAWRARLTKRLAELEAERRRRELLRDDDAQYRARLEEARAAIEGEEEAVAAAAVAALAGRLRAVRIDGTFISRKLKRIDKAKGARRLDPAVSKRVTATFAKVHESYFSGDYRRANAHLNQIWRLLGERM
jgi:hypothetical protein